MKYCAVVCLVLFLAGCKVTVKDTDDRISIKSFSMEDSYGHWYDLYDQDVVKDISPAIHGGRFDVEWHTHSRDREHYATLRLSHDRYGHDSIRIWDDICGVDGSECSRNTEDLSCHFTMDLYMSCGIIGDPFPNHPEVYVGNMLPYLPKQLYLVLETCDKSAKHCDSEYHAIELL